MHPPTILVVRWWRTVKGATIHVQAAWRQFLATRLVQTMREERAATWLQAACRMYDVKRKAAFKRFMVAPHVARTASAVKIQRAYHRMRSLQRWNRARTLHIKWRFVTKIQAVVRGWSRRRAQQQLAGEQAHRVLRMLKAASLPGWDIWPGYARTGMTYERFLSLAVLPAHQLGGEIVLDRVLEEAAAAHVRQEAVVQARLEARSAELRQLREVLVRGGWSAVPVAGTAFPLGTELHALLHAQRNPGAEKEEDEVPEEETSKKPRIENTYQYGEEDDDGNWVRKPPPEGLDMFDETAWKKRQNIALAQWEEDKRIAAEAERRAQELLKMTPEQIFQKIKELVRAVALLCSDLHSGLKYFGNVDRRAK